MGKLDLGIIGLLAVGVGAFALSKTLNNGVPNGTTNKPDPTYIPPASPTTIVPTDNEITYGTGQTGYFGTNGTQTTLPTQIESSTVTQSPVTQEIIDTVKEDLIDGQLDPSQEAGIIEQITNLNAKIDMMFTGQINVDESIKFRANHTSTSGVTISYDWTFTKDGALIKRMSGTANQTVTMVFANAGQYTATLIVSASTGRKSTAVKVFNVIPEPLSYGNVKISIQAGTNSVLIKVQNYRKDQAINGSLNVSVYGANSFTRNYNMYLQSNSIGSMNLTGLNSGSSNFSISYRPVGSSRALDNLSQNVNISGGYVPTTPTNPTPVNPVATPPSLNVTTQLYKGVLARSGKIEKHPTAFTSTHLLINDPLPSRAKKLKYARIYFNGKADNFGFDGARAVVKFNGSTIGTLNWSAFEDHKSKQLDVPVTSKMKESGYNRCDVIYTHSNNLFGQPLASGFIVNGSDLYVEYEY